MLTCAREGAGGCSGEVLASTLKLGGRRGTASCALGLCSVCCSGSSTTETVLAFFQGSFVPSSRRVSPR